MSYHDTLGYHAGLGGLAEKWSVADAQKYMNKWRGTRSKAAIRNFLISEDICDAPAFEGKCAAQLDIAWGEAEKGGVWEQALKAVFGKAVDTPAAPAVTPYTEPGFLDKYGLYLVLGAGGLAVALMLRRRRK